MIYFVEGTSLQLPTATEITPPMAGYRSVVEIASPRFEAVGGEAKEGAEAGAEGAAARKSRDSGLTAPLASIHNRYRRG